MTRFWFLAARLHQRLTAKKYLNN